MASRITAATSFGCDSKPVWPALMVVTLALMRAVSPCWNQLAGEYVVEITDDVAHGIVSRDTSTLVAFARENPDYLATLGRRITSYPRWA
jgi:hypothetical protein